MRIIRLNESEFLGLMKRITEDINKDISRYDKGDWYELFISTFKNWITEKLGENVSKYPFSYLVNKYSKEFLEKLYENEPYVPSQIVDDRGVNWWNAEAILTPLVRKGKLTLKSLRPNEKFTEKYKRPFEKIIKKLDLPDFVTLEIAEHYPHEISISLIIGFEYWLLSNAPIAHVSLIQRKITNFITDYLGIEGDNPIYGGVHVDVNRRFVGEESWVKNVLNKRIKTHIKTLPGADDIQRIHFTVDGDSAELKIVPKGVRRLNSNQLTREIKSYIESLGYKRIRVTTSY